MPSCTTRHPEGMSTRPLRPGTPLTRAYRLRTGIVVRLRMARHRDAGQVAALVNACGLHVDPVALRRLLGFDPTRRAVICATAPVGGTDTLVAVGAMDLRPEAAPDVLFVDPRCGSELRDVLLDALRSRSTRHAAHAA